jgi:hypothetical protein
VRREPVSTPEGRISTRVLAERLPRTVPPITIAAALMLASTWAPSPTYTRPVTLISPSNFPRMRKSPSPATSPLNASRLPIIAPSPVSARASRRVGASSGPSTRWSRSGRETQWITTPMRTARRERGRFTPTCQTAPSRES